MERDKVLAILSRHEQEIRGFGVKSLALFGSVARREERAVSDVDLLVEFDKAVGLFGFIGVKEYLENLLGCKVDLVSRRAVIEELKEDIYREAVNVL